MIGPAAITAEAQRLIVQCLPDVALVDFHLQGGEQSNSLGQRFRGSNHIRRPRQACRPSVVIRLCRRQACTPAPHPLALIVGFGLTLEHPVRPRVRRRAAHGSHMVGPSDPARVK